MQAKRVLRTTFFIALMLGSGSQAHMPERATPPVQSLATPDGALSDPIPGLTLIWPVTPDNRNELGQDYAQFNLLQEAPNKHHTGLDIGSASGTAVRAAAVGKVVKIQENDVGCDRDPNTPAPTPCEDHGYGNTVIVQHTVGNSVAHTQYSHLASIAESVKSACGPVDANRRKRRTCSTPAPVSAGMTVGTVGGSCYGQPDCTGPHLHFEVKTFSTLGTSGDDAGEFGYTSSHPDQRGYRDPILNLHPVTPTSDTRVRVTATGAGVATRIGPARDYRCFQRSASATDGCKSLSSGEEFIAFSVSPGTAGCSTGWYQIRPTNGSYFSDLSRGVSTIPDAWVCRGNNSEVWVEPIDQTCVTRTIAVGASVNGALSESDCEAPHRASRKADLYTFTGSAGQRVMITLTSTAFDAYLVLAWIPTAHN